jgi:rhodanese-related sulfurtransferase
MPLTAMDLVQAAKQQIEEIEPTGAQALLGQVPVLDVREPAEFAGGCLPGAVNIPRGVLEFRIGTQPDCKPEMPVLVYCQSGGRSALAVEALRKMGYEKAVSLAGGYKGWQESGLSVVTPV